MLGSTQNIPLLSLKNLNLMDNPGFLNTSNDDWKSSFYFRNIKPSVALAISQDFPDIEGIEQIKALQKFVNSPNDNAYRDFQLTHFLKNFDKIASQSLPAKVTIKLIKPHEKKIVEECYQNLILLEVIYHIEQLNNSLDNEQNTLSQWVAAKKKTLTLFPLRLTVRSINRLFEIDEIYNSLTLQMPYAFQLFFKHLKQGVKTSSYAQASLKDIALSTFSAGFIPLFLLASVFLRVLNACNNLTSIPFELIKRNLNHSSKWKWLLNPLEIIKNGYLIFKLGALTLPFVLPIVGYSMAIYLSAYILGGASVYLLRQVFRNNEAIRRYFELSEHQRATPNSMHFLQWGILTISSIIPSLLSNKLIQDLHQGYDEGVDYYHAHSAEFFALPAEFPLLKKIVGNYSETMDEEEKLRREEILEQTTQFLDKLERLLQESDFTTLKYYELAQSLLTIHLPNWANLSLAQYKQKSVDYLKQHLKLNVPTANESIADDAYDQQSMIKTLMRLKSNLNQENTELAELVRGINPMTYCQEHPRVSQLPGLLQAYTMPSHTTTVPSTEEQAENTEELSQSRLAS